MRPDGTRPKILHVEDNRENRMLVRAILESEGYIIIDAEDGLAGIEAAIREEPSLILLDVNLPGVDGYEVVAIIKSFPTFATTPVIAVTAYAMEGDRQRTLVAGCDGYIQKPIDVDAFPRQVAEFLHGKREHVEEREEGVYLRELNQRLVYRLVNQVEELKRLNQHFVRRASQLADLHGAVQDITAELGVQALLERFLPNLARALGTTALTVELSEPAGVRVSVTEETAAARPRSVLAGAGVESEDWAEVEWKLPLVVRGRHLGVMTARQILPPGAKADEEQLLNIVANQVAIAVENGRLLEEKRVQLRQTETLLSVSQAVGSTLDLTEILRRTTRAMVRAIGADVGAAWLLNPARDRYVPLSGYHIPKGALERLTELEMRTDDPWLEEPRRRRRALCSNDSQRDPRIDHAIVRVVPHKSLLFQPMFWNDEMIGGFSVAWTHEQHAFTDDELRLVEGIALQAAVAVENSRLFQGVKDQMAELKRTQAQLVQSTKLAAIGELAANIAHEINNPLTTVLGFASFRAERLEPGDPLREELALIQEEASRARDIVRDLLHFSRQRDFMPAPTELNVVLEQTVSMVRRQGALNGVDVVEQYSPTLPVIELDVSRIKQVVLNIVNNAIFAMKNGGTLTIRTWGDADNVHVQFVDTGTGIPPEHLGRIFDPFFTTKPEVSGTGLGLSVSLGIVQSHGGTIDVSSTVGEGSTFTIKLPIRPPERPED
ncbi:MAG TPA: ATP-binding protein [Methylomirabilota bacterium]